MTRDTVTLDNGTLSVEVALRGAELQRLTLNDGRELLWHGDAAFWGGRAPILFPIVGKAPDDQVTVGGQGGRMAQHGFARRSDFALESAAPDRCRHVLTDSPETLAVYPCPFRLVVTHALTGAGLEVTAEVTNTGTAAMPFGLGFHPAFAWPLPGAAGRGHSITLANGGAPALARLGDGLLAPERLPSPFADGVLTLDHALFGADAMIFPEGAGDALTYAADAEGAPRLSFRFHNTPNLGIWSKPGAPFVCIEPWHGMAARTGAGPEIADRPDSVTLAPGAVARFGWSVTVEGS